MTHASFFWLIGWLASWLVGWLVLCGQDGQSLTVSVLVGSALLPLFFSILSHSSHSCLSSCLQLQLSLHLFFISLSFSPISYPLEQLRSFAASSLAQIHSKTFTALRTTLQGQQLPHTTLSASSSIDSAYQRLDIVVFTISFELHGFSQLVQLFPFRNSTTERIHLNPSLLHIAFTLAPIRV